MGSKSTCKVNENSRPTQKPSNTEERRKRRKLEKKDWIQILPIPLSIPPKLQGKTTFSMPLNWRATSRKRGANRMIKEKVKPSRKGTRLLHFLRSSVLDGFLRRPAIR
jgi:hypothetical protein